MEKKRRHVYYNRLSNILFIKHQLKYFILRSIKFNRNIKNTNQPLFHFYATKKKNSISRLKSVCVFSGYKRAIINKFSSSRFVANKLAKHGLLTNFKP